MRAHTLITSAVAAFSALVSGSGYTAPAWTYKSQNQSSLFGYQLIGSHIFDTKAVCDSVSVASHGIWSGVDTSRIQRAFCDQVETVNGTALNETLGWDFDIIKENTRFYSTGTFISHLMYSFDLSRYPNDTSSTSTVATSWSPFAHLCSVLQPAYLEAFNIDSDRVRAAVCDAANLSVLPAPPTNSTAVNPAALDSYDEKVSTLFAYLLMMSSRSGPDADQICFSARDRQAEVENSGMIAHTVYNVACGRDGRRLSGYESGTAMKLWTTKVHLQILENASEDLYWMDWLCNNLDAASMNVTVLDGDAIKREVCGKGKIGIGGGCACGTLSGYDDPADYL